MLIVGEVRTRVDFQLDSGVVGQLGDPDAASASSRAGPCWHTMKASRMLEPPKQMLVVTGSGIGTCSYAPDGSTP